MRNPVLGTRPVKEGILLAAAVRRRGDSADETEGAASR